MRVLSYSYRALHGVPSDATANYNVLYEWFSPSLTIFDRSEVIASPFAMLNTSPLPTESVPLTFARCCDKRASELVATGQILSVLWSGGIDSTTALIALLKASPKPGQITVRLMHRSISEHPKFYQETVANLPQEFIDDVPAITYKPGELLITGELADQLFGSSQCFRLGDKMHDDYSQVVPAAIVDILAPVITKFPVGLKSFYDLIWFFAFVFRWQEIKYRKYPFLASPKLGVMESFFDTEDFQQWAIWSDERKLSNTAVHFNDVMSHKRAAKQYIEAFTKDAAYSMLKMKKGSWGGKFARTEWSFIYENGSIA